MDRFDRFTADRFLCSGYTSGGQGIGGSSQPGAQGGGGGTGQGGMGGQNTNTKPTKPGKPTPGQGGQNTQGGPGAIGSPSFSSGSIQTTSPMASSGAITQPTAPTAPAPQLPVVSSPGAGSGSTVVSMPGAGTLTQGGPDASDSLLDLYDQLMDAQRQGGDASGGDLGEVGTSMFNSFPEFASSPAGKGTAIVALIALVAGGVFLMRKAA